MHRILTPPPRLSTPQVMERLLCRCLSPPTPHDPSPRLLLSWSTQRSAAPAPFSSTRERRPTPLLASLGIAIPAPRSKPQAKRGAKKQQQQEQEPDPAAAVAAVVLVEEAEEEEGVVGAAQEEDEALHPDALTALFAPSSSSSSKTTEAASPPRPLRLSYSSLYQYQACPLSYYYAHVLALPTRCVTLRRH